MEENLGMVMVFTVVSAAMEWLGSKWEAVKEAREEREKEKKERIEAEERVSCFVSMSRIMYIHTIFSHINHICNCKT